MTVYLQPTGPTAEIALLPGDPKRAMELANRVMVAPRMSNLSRGLWGYYGETPDGRELTVQSTGIGAPAKRVDASRRERRRPRLGHPLRCRRTARDRDGLGPDRQRIRRRRTPCRRCPRAGVTGAWRAGRRGLGRAPGSVLGDGQPG